MASALTEAARDGALPRPAAIVALSPWTDLALAGDRMTARAMHDPPLTRAALEKARHLYLRGFDAKDSRASPLYGDLTHLPPVLLHVGEDEILLDDSRRYADRAAQPGSPAELHEWQGMVHVFPANLALLRRARGTRYLGRIPPAQPRYARPSRCHPAAPCMEKRHDSHPVRRPEA
jgi:epsilon-lactone hydrolase